MKAEQLTNLLLFAGLIISLVQAAKIMETANKVDDTVNDIRTKLNL